MSFLGVARYEGHEFTRQFDVDTDDREKRYDARGKWRGLDVQARAEAWAEDAALKWAEGEEKRLEAGDDPERQTRAARRATIAELADDWLDGKRKIRASTRAGYRSVIDHRIVPVWGHVPVGSVKRKGVDEWVSAMVSAGLSASRVRHSFVILHAILGKAVEEGRIPRNPADGVELPPLPTRAERPMKALTASQLLRLADAAEEVAGVERGRLPVEVMGWCGLRWGELAGLEVRDLDEVGRVLRIERTKSETGGRLPETVQATKSGKGREIDLPEWLVPKLAEAAAGKGPTAPLLAAQRGGPLRQRAWRARVFDKAVKLAGIDVELPGFTPHGLRHSAATLHAEAGTPIGVVSELLGHSKPSITADVYSHVFRDSRRRHIDALGAMAERLQAEQRRNSASHLRAVGDE